MKKIIPNILTISRLLVSPVIIYMGLKKQILPLIIIAIFIALTDFLDGRLARMWNASSILGAKLDAIGDKVLAFSLLAILIFENHYFFYVLLFEFLIALFNLYTFYKTKAFSSLLVGKIKTWVIFFAIILGFINMLLFNKINILVNLFVILTVILQFASLIEYINNYIVLKNQKKKQNFLDKEYYKIVKPILENEEFLKRKDFPHHYNESVYTHTLRVSYDCYKIGKKWKLDYKALAIAGLLHDFYETPWQSDFKHKPFFQKHGFTHAENARVNALKYFPELMNKKIESMIKTHMFPLNKALPKYKESWILTLVDKADSIDFLFHPLMLTKLVRKHEENKKKKEFSK